MNMSFKIAFRNLHSEKFYVLINVFGLAVAMVCTFLIGLHVQKELNYDRHIPQHENLYRASIDLINANGTNTFAWMSPFMGPALAAQSPAIQDYVRFRASTAQSLIRVDNEPYYWDGVFETDDNVFEIFGIRGIYGDAQTALVDPAAVAISNRFNQIHFGGRDSTGAIITVNGRDLRVTLVYEDLPENSHLKHDVLMSINGLAFPEPSALPMSLFMVNTYTYFKMSPNYDADLFPEFFDTYWAATTAEALEGSDASSAMHLMPVADVHYGPTIEFDQPVGNIFIVYAYGVIGLLILLVACVNYINLATARSAHRLKEVAMRKLMGANRDSLVSQFLLESTAIAGIAGVVALAFTEVLIQSGVALFFDDALEPGLYRDPLILIAFLVGSLSIGLLSGLYPAFYLSAQFVMPGKVRNENRKAESMLRQILVVFQFTVTVSVIASSLLLIAQMRFIQNAPLGFAKENRIVVSVKGVDYIERTDVLASQWRQLPQVAGVALTAVTPAVDSYSGNWLVENNAGALEQRFLNFQNVDANYLDVMDMELLEGRFFGPADQRNLVVVNEALVQQMGWENPIGKRTGMPGDALGLEIVGGVVKDFHFAGLQSAIGPLILRQTNSTFYGVVSNPAQRASQTAMLTVALVGGADPESIAQLESLWLAVIPELPFDYRYLGDIVRSQYDSENRILDFIAVFAAVCIVISCLGLLGLSAYSTQRRTREIGIRKVFGANARQIMTVLFKNIFVTVALGSIIASFASYFVIAAWLEGFAYRDQINLFVFPAASALALCLAFSTMALQSWSTIRQNPVLALRYE